MGPESILPMVVMDSGLAAARRPGMTMDRVYPFLTSPSAASLASSDTGSM